MIILLYFIKYVLRCGNVEMKTNLTRFVKLLISLAFYYQIYRPYEDLSINVEISAYDDINETRGKLKK
ncbi:hypothetical protein KUTeg_018744 [Tegillarca granosa]|uniref:Uncharacterized protein n=1 Tax=Tegillarca granosa TaxID=220873 RepID=A0ABQ9EGB8_TEGGR|nr:hypothetical protein KUTeg_018744 [Tegillarca granosa]